MALLSLRMVQEFYLTGLSQPLEQLAAKLDDQTDEKKRKTMIRRLYDITNVFKAVGLVKKNAGEEKNISIEWLGRLMT